MIGQLTEMTINASALSLVYEQLAWPQDPESYVELRDEALRLLVEIGIEDVEFPATHDEFLEARPEITATITRYLSQERGRILGDTVALPFFYLQSFAMRAALNMGLRTEDTGELELIEECLEDLGLDRELSAVLAREAGWITLFEGPTDEETTVGRGDVIRASGSFFVQVIEEFGRQQEGLEGLLAGFKDLSASVEEFHAEQREANTRVEQLIREGNEEVKALLGQLKSALVQEGLDPVAAQELTEGDPEQLWDRVVRWLGGAGPRDAAEAAFWVALDFVPGGVGVKLGIRIAEAVRKSIKSGSK